MIGIVIYWGREQEIDFAEILPNELEHCGNNIGQDTEEYNNLKNWFESNNRGWEETYASYVPTHTYTSPNLSVYVLMGSVIVNYKTENGSWRQVAKTVKSNELYWKCKETNN